MKILTAILQIIGSMGFLLYGMKLMSSGTQKSSSGTLQKVLGLMTGNRVLAVFTGMLITMVIQSSGATTVMVVSFVNAGILSLTQSVGVIFGANIGTTVTAWIVALFGFNFKISLLAVPAFGFGYALSAIKKLHKENLGEALMGFGLLFMGLELLKDTVSVDANNVGFLTSLMGMGVVSVAIAVLAGIVITMILHSSSASTAIILALSFNKLLTFEFAASMVLGSNIGSTVDSVIASLGTKVNARRAALVHVLFNVAGVIVAVIFLKPLILLVDLIVPGSIESAIIYHVAMLHTVFNVIVTLAFLPFTNQIALLTQIIIKPGKNDAPTEYKLVFPMLGTKENAAAFIIQAEKEIADMSELVARMFERIQKGIIDRNKKFIDEYLEPLKQEEEFADQMQEQLSKYLIQCAKLPLGERLSNNVNIMLQIVADLESMTDDCYSVAVLLKRSIEKHMHFEKEDMDRLIPYIDLAHQFLLFIRENINKRLSQEKLVKAREIEEQIDMFRKNLKKIARKRLEGGADVKAELLYIDIVRQIEKFGDKAFSISENLSQTK